MIEIDRELYSRFFEAFLKAQRAIRSFNAALQSTQKYKCRHAARKQMQKRNASRLLGRSKARSARGQSQRFHHPEKAFVDIQPRGVIFAD